MVADGVGDGRGVGRFMGLAMREVVDPGRPVTLVAESEIVPSIIDENGLLHAGALFTMCDCVAGFCGGLGALPDGWVVTTNLMIRSEPVVVTAPLQLVSTVLRRGRNAVVTEVRARDALDQVVAHGTLTSAVLTPSEGVPHWERPAHLDMHAPHDGPHFDTWLGITVDGSDVVLELVDDLRNPWGIMHGGVTSALVDAAAKHATRLARSDAGRRVRTNDVALHFLAPAKVGPVYASGRVLGVRPDGTIVEVEVRDRGADNRLVAFAIATVGNVRRS